MEGRLPPADSTDRARVDGPIPPFAAVRTMALPGWIGTLWMTRFSRPAGERTIWRQVLRHPPQRILEVGMGTLARTERLLGLVAGLAPVQPVQFVGIDRFESRTPADAPGVTLKQAHKRLTPLAKVQLVPGNAEAALARVGNHIGVFDLVLVSADEEPRNLEKAWFFIQRVVRAESTILVEPSPGAAWLTLEPARLQELAARPLQRRAA